MQDYWQLLARAFTYQRQEADSSSRQAATLLSLAALAGLSAGIYLWAFADRYSLFEWYQKPQLTVYQLSKFHPAIYSSLVSAFIVQAGFYWLGWRMVRQVQGRLAWLVVLSGALVSASILLFLYPFDAADIFDYIIHGRIQGIYGANPYQVVPNQFPNDPFLQYAAWNSDPSPYGPLWALLAATTARLAGNGIIANVIAFKLLVGIFWAGNIGLVATILRRAAPERMLAGVFLFAWNPLVLYETFGNGHNDMTLIFCLLLAVWMLQSRRFTGAILALVAGILFKFIPALLLPAAGLIVLRQLPNLPARLRFVAVTALAVGVLLVTVYYPFWLGLDTLPFGRRSQLFTASLPAMAYTWFTFSLDWKQAAFFINLIAAGATFMFAVWQGWRASRNPSWLSFTEASLNILLFYLLLTCPWFQQWYALWPLSLAILLPPGRKLYLTLLLGGYTLFAKHLIFGPFFFRVHPLPKAWREILFGPTVLIVPWLYALQTLWRANRVKAEIA